MRILGLDASTEVGTSAILVGNELIGEIWFSSTRTHSERLLQHVDQVFSGAGMTLKDLDGLAVGLGPGSFTGLRIALATVKGLALALDVPLVGVSTIEVIAHNAAFWPELICASLDARQGFVYGGVFEAGCTGILKRVEPEDLREMTSWARSLRQRTLFLGNGAVVYQDVIRRLLGTRAFFAPPELLHPRGSVVARLGMKRLERRGGDDLETLEPMYIQRPMAERLLRPRVTETGGED